MNSNVIKRRINLHLVGESLHILLDQRNGWIQSNDGMVEVSVPMRINTLIANTGIVGNADTTHFLPWSHGECWWQVLSSGYWIDLDIVHVLCDRIGTYSSTQCNIGFCRNHSRQIPSRQKIAQSSPSIRLATPQVCILETLRKSRCGASSSSIGILQLKEPLTQVEIALFGISHPFLYGMRSVRHLDRGNIIFQQ